MNLGAPGLRQQGPANCREGGRGGAGRGVTTLQRRMGRASGVPAPSHARVGLQSPVLMELSRPSFPTASLPRPLSWNPLPWGNPRGTESALRAQAGLTLGFLLCFAFPSFLGETPSPGFESFLPFSQKRLTLSVSHRTR